MMKAGGDLLSRHAFLFYEPRLCPLCFDAASLLTKAVSRISQIETLHHRERERGSVLNTFYSQR